MQSLMDPDIPKPAHLRPHQRYPVVYYDLHDGSPGQQYDGYSAKE